MNHVLVAALMQPGDDDPLEALRALIDRPAWHADAACKEHDPGLWFPKKGGHGPGPAIEVCNGCLVRSECAEHAIGDPTLRGVWGGMSEPERRRLRSEAA